uniref:Uncharacterized protein n=1 Tax=Oryza glumipatula TaxID=40148 RepID=A0A0E0B1X1_9ORYZ
MTAVHAVRLPHRMLSWLRLAVAQPRLADARPCQAPSGGNTTVKPGKERNKNKNKEYEIKRGKSGEAVSARRREERFYMIDQDQSKNSFHISASNWELKVMKMKI